MPRSAPDAAGWCGRSSPSRWRCRRSPAGSGRCWPWPASARWSRACRWPTGLEDALAVDWTLFAVAFGLSLAVGVVVALAPVRALVAGRAARARAGALHRRGGRGGPAPRPRRARGGGGGAGRAAGRRRHDVHALGATASTPSTPASIRPTSRPSTSVAPTRVMAAPGAQAFFAALTERVAGLPGVAAAGLVTRVPLRDGGWQGTVTIEDRPDLARGPRAERALPHRHAGLSSARWTSRWRRAAPSPPATALARRRWAS